MGQLADHELGQDGHLVHVHVGDRVVEDGQSLGGQLLGARVDEVQLEVVPGEHPRELESDVADAEDRHRGHDQQRLEQQADLTATALHAVLERRLVRQRDLEDLRSGGSLGDHRPGALDGDGLEVAAADRVPGRVGGDDHLGAGLARRMTAHRRDGDEYADLPLLAEPLDRLHPLHRDHTPTGTRERAVSTAHQTASGVAGEARSTLVPAGPNAAAACRSASRTEKASITGGSPTALEP